MNRRNWLRLLIAGVITGPLVGKLAPTAAVVSATTTSTLSVTGIDSNRGLLLFKQYKPGAQWEVISFDADGFTINRPPFSDKNERS